MHTARLEEVQQLRRCIRDLVALSALPAVWSAGDAQAVADHLAEVLLRTLHLDLVHVRVTGSYEEDSFETACAGQQRLSSEEAREIGKALAPWQQAGDSGRPTPIPDPLGGTRRLHAAVVPIGIAGDCGVLVAGSHRPQFPTVTDRLLLQLAANQAAIALQHRRAEAGEQRRSRQLRRLAEASLALNSSLSLEAVLRVLTEQAREIIGAHQGVASQTANENWAQSIHAISLSEKYAAYRGYSVKPDGSGIYSLVCRPNQPMHMTQAELEAHAAWHGFGAEAGRHPPLRGWLAAPLIGRDGRNIGLIQLSDKYEGEFTEEDEAILVQLAQMASVAIENAHLYEEVKEADRRKDEFLATLAHELRNPLAPLRNALQILRMSGYNEQVQEMMERQVRHMVHLVDDLLEVSRITRGKIELRKERLDLASVVRNAVETSQPLIEASDHELTVALPPEPLWVEGDAVRLSQVIANLLNNAAKYTDRGGRIWLTAEREGAGAALRVRDSGIGIPAELLPRIFEMFAQGDGSRGRTQGGLGIGLTLVRSLVQMHGGRVEARSDGPGRGSEFIVRLPLAPAIGQSEGGDRLGHRGPAAASAGHRILVVDDNRDAAESLGELLKILGNEVEVVHDGPSALAALGAWRPAIVLLDIGMPGMDGYEVARRMRAQPEFERTVLIALTGWGQEDDRRRSRAAGFDHHLVKPVDFTALAALLSGLRVAEPEAAGPPAARAPVPGEAGQAAVLRRRG